jgi:hypothetical protein
MIAAVVRAGRLSSEVKRSAASHEDDKCPGRADSVFCQIGSTVVCLMSERTILEFTS